MDSTTNDDLAWIAKIKDNRALADVEFPEENEEGISFGRSVNATTAWLRDARVVIICDDILE